MRGLARICLALLLVGVMALYLPALFDKLFSEKVEKTHLLFSPVLKRFVWREKAYNPPPEALAKAEDHHAEFVYRDEDGAFYRREEFEKLLPFIYYKNMELWGLLPLLLEGKSFDAAAIRDERRVFELSARELAPVTQPPGLFPVLESAPGQARLVYPEDRCRLAAKELECLNADTNARDPELSRLFSQALREAGFVFPAKLAASSRTILKPFDAGVFLVDADERLFRLTRIQGKPRVQRASLPSDLRVRHILISESKQRQHLGLLLGEDGRLGLLSEELGFFELPLPGYEPERMDFKLVLDPLYATALYADERVIRGLAMDRDFQPLRAFEHRMSVAEIRPVDRLAELLFPFRLALEESPAPGLRLRLGSVWSLAGCALSVGALALLRRRRGASAWSPFGLVLAGLTGFYGLLAAALALDEE